MNKVGFLLAALLLVMPACIEVPSNPTTGVPPTSPTPPRKTSYEVVAACPRIGDEHPVLFTAAELENATIITSPERLPAEARAKFFEEISGRIRTFRGESYASLNSTLSPSHSTAQDEWVFDILGSQYSGFEDHYFFRLNETAPSNVTGGPTNLGAVSPDAQNEIWRIVNMSQELRGHFLTIVKWNPDWGHCVIAFLDKSATYDPRSPFWTVAVDLAKGDVLAAEYRTDRLTSTPSPCHSC